ncbi:hypothetical protein Tco_1099434 [Tanacetum coccineum]
MLQICPKLPNQQFEELPFEEEILTFLRNLGHSGEIKVITDVTVNKMHQPWRSFAAVINKCLSGKSTGYDSLRLSQAQILWGMYHKKNVDYAYLLWEDFVYQVGPRMPKGLYGAILPNELTNEDIKDSEFYKEYYAIALGAEPPKTKASVKKKQVGSDKTKTPPTAKGKRLKTLAKLAKPTKKKQPEKTSKAKGLKVLSEAALTETEQMKLDEEEDDEVGMNDNDDDNDDDDDADNQDDNDQEHDGQDDVNDQTNSDNDGDDFVHPKLSTHDEEDKEEEGSDLRVQTPFHYKSTDDEVSGEDIQGANVEGDEMDAEETNKEEEEVDELYRDVNVNLEGRDTEMTDAPCTIVQTTQVIEDTHVIITPVNPKGQQQSSSVSSGFVSNMFNPSPDTGIDSIFNLNTELTSLVDVSVTTIAETPILSATTLPPQPFPLISHLQQTLVPIPATVPSSSLQDLPNFGSLFGFDHRLKTLENDFSEFKQMNQFVAAVSLILSIIDTYITNKMNEAIKTAILPNIKKNINEQLEAEVLTHSSTESKTSHAIAASLSELELKKILIDKMESNKSIHISDE